MLHTHEDILLQMKVFLMPLESRADNNAASRKRTKHIRWLSYESSQGFVPGRALTLGTTSPSGAANVAKVFQRKVGDLLLVEARSS